MLRKLVGFVIKNFQEFCSDVMFLQKVVIALEKECLICGFVVKKIERGN